ncbi:MAG: hypothetical protein J0H01_35860 [Rhizobiales bacterium]|nr:hypothetical protein [Hyphomicrobiales bacterium]
MHIDKVIRDLVSSSPKLHPLYRHELIIRLGMWARYPSDENTRTAAISTAALRYCAKRSGTTLGDLQPRFRKLLDRTIDIGWLAKAAAAETDAFPSLQGNTSEKLRDENGKSDPIDQSFEKYAFLSEIVQYLLWVDSDKNASISKAIFIACHRGNEKYWKISRETAWRWVKDLRPSVPFFYLRQDRDFQGIFLNPFERDYVRKLDELAANPAHLHEFLATAKLIAERLERRLQGHMPRRSPKNASRAIGRRSVRSFFGFPRFPKSLNADLELRPEPPEQWVYEALKDYKSADSS